MKCPDCQLWMRLIKVDSTEVGVVTPAKIYYHYECECGAKMFIEATRVPVEYMRTEILK